MGTIKGCKRRRRRENRENLALTDGKEIFIFSIIQLFLVRRNNIDRLENSRISTDSEADTNGKISGFKIHIKKYDRYMASNLAL